MTARLQSIIKQRPLVAFFVLAYAITWICQIAGLVLAERQALALSNEDNLLLFLSLLRLQLPFEHAAAYVVYTLGAGPLFAALLVTWVIAGRAGVAELAGRITKWRVRPHWWLVVLGLPLLLSGISLLVGALAGALDFGAWNPKLPLTHALPFVLYMMIFTGFWEEVGWRGFALPHLQRRYSAQASSWILGIVWGFWHVPFIIYYNQAQHPLFLIPTLLLLTIGIVGWTIVNTWVYNNTESILLMIVLHGWANAVQSYLILAFPNMVVQTLYGFLPWVLAWVLLRVYGPEHLAPRPRPQASYAPVERAYSASVSAYTSATSSAIDSARRAE